MQIAKLYAKLILAGRKTFEEVPENYKAAVKTLLEEKKQGAKFFMIEYINLNGARVFLGKIRGEFLTQSAAESTYLKRTGAAEGAYKDGNGDNISATYIKKNEIADDSDLNNYLENIFAN